MLLDPSPVLFRYTQNGILHMLDRNRRIKPRPERFQGCKEHFEVIITCEERVYDQVLEGEQTYFVLLLLDTDLVLCCVRDWQWSQYEQY